MFRTQLMLLLCMTLPATSQVPVEINISFQKTAATAATLAPAAFPVEGGVLVNTALETWNAITTETNGLSFSGIPLVLSDGAPAGAAISATVGYARDSNGVPWNDKDHVVMDAWVGLKESEFITVSNLPPSFTANGYTVFIHGDSNSGERLMSYTVAGRTQVIDDTFTFAGDHELSMLAFGNLTHSTFTIIGNESGQRSAVNALRIVPNPPQSIHVSFQKTAAHRDALAAGNLPSAAGSIVNPLLTFWNTVTTDVDGWSPAGLPLQWADGAASPVTLSGDPGYAHGSNAGTNAASLRDKDAVLFDSWIGLSGNESVTIGGLPPAFTSRGYQLILYGDANETNRTMSFTVAGRTLTLEDRGTYTGDPRPFMLVWRDLTAADFTITGNPAGQSRSAVSGLRILPNDLPVMPAIKHFRASDHYVEPDTDVVVSWAVEGADSLVMDGGVGNVAPLTTNGSGSLVFTVHSNTVLTLTASNSWGVSHAALNLHTGPPRPNLVVVLIDDMGMMGSSEPFAWDEDGVPVLHPTMPYRTPQMERMADMGMKFPTAYAMSVCSPTRTCIMTGMNSVRHGMTDWSSGSLQSDPKDKNHVLEPPPDWSYQGVLDNHVLLTDLLAGAGYRNLLVGKTHWGKVGNNPFDAGFHRAVGYASGSDKLDYFGLPGLAKYTGTGTYVTEALTLEMKALMNEAVDDGVPFYAYVSHFAVHTPHQLDPRFAANYPTLTDKALNFATMIEGIDKSLGDILDQLEILGVAEDTLVVFLGDNGSDAPIGNDNSPPLHGRKGTEWQGGSRVPFLVAWAKPDPTNIFQQAFPVIPDTVEHDLVTVYDLFPTLLEVAGVSFSHGIDGISLVPYLAGAAGIHRPQEHLLHYPHDHRGSFYSFLRSNDWKLIFDYETASYRLYDLANDLAETIDLAASDPERTMAMARRMAVLLNDAGALWPVAETNGVTRYPHMMPLLPSVDLDADGLPDNTEDPNRNGLTDPGETNPDSDDTDRDRTPDGAELQLGLNPLDPASFFGVTGAVDEITDRFLLAWPSKPGSRFDVKTSSDLVNWNDLAVDIPAETGSSTTFDTGQPGPDPQMFRIGLRPHTP